MIVTALTIDLRKGSGQWLNLWSTIHSGKEQCGQQHLVKVIEALLSLQCSLAYGGWHVYLT